jgi:hypothetical protein
VEDGLHRPVLVNQRLQGKGSLVRACAGKYRSYDVHGRGRSFQG